MKSLSKNSLSYKKISATARSVKLYISYVSRGRKFSFFEACIKIPRFKWNRLFKLKEIFIILFVKCFDLSV